MSGPNAVPAAGPTPTAPATTITDPGSQGEAPAFLYVEKGPGAGQLVPLRQGTLVIGRGSGADLRLVHPSISRKHAAVTREGEQFFVRDFGSQNGTFVNQLRSPQEMELFPGDELAIGNAVLRLRSRADQDDAPTSARVSTGLWLSGVSRSSSGLLMMVMAAAISLGLVVALGWALLSGPPSPTMQAEPTAAVPSPAPAVAPAASPAAPAAPAADSARQVEREAAAQREAAALREAEARREQEARAAAEAAAAPLARAPSAPADRAVAADRSAPERSDTTGPSRPRALDDAYARASVPPSEPAPVESRPAPRPAPAPRASASSGAMSREVLAAYESGDVDRALTLARRAGESGSVSKLQNFQQAYVAGNRAIAQRDGVGAIRNFARALKVDESISKGWGTYGPELRGRLATLYVAAGRQRNQQGDVEGAREAFRAALKYDPKHAEAKRAAALLGAE